MKSNNDGAAWQTLMPLSNALTGLFTGASGSVYAASALTLERSDDGGATWSSASVDVRQLAIAPSNPERVYGITGQFVRVSADGGAAFDAGADMRPSIVYDLSVDPSDALTVYAATSGGLLVSRDGGASWVPTSTGLAGTTDVGAHPTLPGRFLAVGRGFLYQSDDSGDSWVRREDAPPGCPPASTSRRTRSRQTRRAARCMRSPTLAPAGRSTQARRGLHVGVHPCPTAGARSDAAEPRLDGDMRWRGGGPLRLSVNSGDTWSTPTGFPGAVTLGCPYTVQFSSRGALYILGDQLYVSRDAGTTWTASSTSRVPPGPSKRLAISPDGRIVFVASTGGLFRSAIAAPVSAL